MISEHVKVSAHPVPVVLQPAKYLLQSASEELTTLSVHFIGRQTESDQIQAF